MNVASSPLASWSASCCLQNADCVIRSCSSRSAVAVAPSIDSVKEGVSISSEL